MFHPPKRNLVENSAKCKIQTIGPTLIKIIPVLGTPFFTHCGMKVKRDHVVLSLVFQVGPCTNSHTNGTGIARAFHWYDCWRAYLKIYENTTCGPVLYLHPPKWVSVFPKQESILLVAKLVLFFMFVLRWAQAWWRLQWMLPRSQRHQAWRKEGESRQWLAFTPIRWAKVENITFEIPPIKFTAREREVLTRQIAACDLRNGLGTRVATLRVGRP